jgi:hypothetical protein
VLGNSFFRLPDAYPTNAKLTPTFVQKATAEPGAERTVYWDDTMPGFGLAVTKGGHRSFNIGQRTDRFVCEVTSLHRAIDGR